MLDIFRRKSLLKRDLKMHLTDYESGYMTSGDLFELVESTFERYKIKEMRNDTFVKYDFDSNNNIVVYFSLDEI